MSAIFLIIYTHQAIDKTDLENLLWASRYNEPVEKLIFAKYAFPDGPALNWL